MQVFFAIVSKKHIVGKTSGSFCLIMVNIADMANKDKCANFKILIDNVHCYLFFSIFVVFSQIVHRI